MHEQPVVSRLRRRPSRSARTFESNEPKIAPICTQETVIDHSVISCFLDNALMHCKSGTACPCRSLPRLAPNWLLGQIC
ncbi:Seipin-1 [Trichinella pseudospiralis]